MASNEVKSFNFTIQRRVAPLNGPTSSEAWSDVVDEISVDLASVSQEWNNKIVPLLNSLPRGVEDTAIDALKNGIDGRTIYMDHDVVSTDDDTTFWDSTNSRPVTVKEAVEDVYDYVGVQIALARDDIIAATNGLTTAQKNAIGANIFDSGSTSSSSSLDGKSENNRLNIIQIAKDLYGSANYSLDNDGNTNLANSLYTMVDALLEAHNGNWDDDVALSHAGMVTVAQSDINSSAPGDDSLAVAPTNLETDLDQIRTRIKTLKGTAGWLTSLTALYIGGADSLEELLVNTSGSASKSASNPWGYQWDNIDGLQTRLEAVRDFTGQDSVTDATPTYSSTNFINNSDSLETAIGTLDQVAGVQSGLDTGNAAQLAALETFVGQDNNTDSTPSYSSTNFISDGDSLETAVGKLDTSLYTVSGQDTLLELNDTLSTYVGKGDTILHVNSGETAVEATDVQISGANITTAGDIEITASGMGLIMSSPDSTRWRIQIDNTGTLTTTSI